MHGYNHVLVGGAMAVGWGLAVERGIAPGWAWVGAFATGLVSHALLDMIPHDDDLFQAWQEVALAVVALVVIGWLSWPRHPGIVLAGAIGGGFPDVEHLPELLGYSHFPKRFPTHSGRWGHAQGSRVGSLMVQLPLAVVCLGSLFLYGRIGGG